MRYLPHLLLIGGLGGLMALTGNPGPHPTAQHTTQTPTEQRPTIDKLVADCATLAGTNSRGSMDKEHFARLALCLDPTIKHLQQRK